MGFILRFVLSLASLLLPFSAFAYNEIWQYVSPVPNLAQVGEVPIFSFYVPAEAREKQISIGITFFSSYGSSTSCSGVIINQAYNNACVCPGLEDRTYFISQENLFNIIDHFSPGSVGSVNCARIRDNKNFSAVAYHQTTCAGSTCTNLAESTVALPADTTTGNACTC